MKYIEFDYLQGKLNVSPNGVIKGLQVLQDRDHMLKFESIGEQPLVQLTEERRPSLNLSKKELEKHRNTLLKKLEYMMGYIETEICREVYIRRYFGEENVASCGHCDNCINSTHSEKPVTEDDLRRIKSALGKGAKTFDQISRSGGWSKSQAKRLLGYLVRENKVMVREDKYVWKN